MNCQILKIETPHNQTIHNQALTQDYKGLNKFKENNNRKKDYLTITKRYRMEGS